MAEPNKRRKRLLIAGGVAVAILVGVGLWHAIFDRPPKFARTVAADFPADAVSMVAVDDPARWFDLFDDVLPVEIREQLDGDPGQFLREDSGLDLEAPMGAALVDVDEPIVVISLGLDDEDEVRAQLETLGEGLGVGWAAREFGDRDVDGLWLDEPPIAVMFRRDRVLIVASEDADGDAVADAADEVADLRRRKSLARSDGFRKLHRFQGDPIIFGYANMAMLSERPEVVATLGSTGVEALAIVLSADDEDIHLITQWVYDEDSTYLDYARGAHRNTKALDRVPGPVYGGVHWRIDPGYLGAALDDLGRGVEREMAELEDEVQRELGVDLEDDVFERWTGEAGLLWTNAGAGHWGGIGFLGVDSEAKAEALVETVWSNTDGRGRERTDAGTVYTWDDDVEFAVKVWKNQLWFGVGDSRLDEVDGDAKGFRKTTKVDAIERLLADDSSTISWLDLQPVIALAREAFDHDHEADRFSEVLDHLLALTMRTEVSGQTLTATITLHTSYDDAFETLLRQAVDGLGD